jgi:hypothetical protein
VSAPHIMVCAACDGRGKREPWGNLGDAPLEQCSPCAGSGVREECSKECDHSVDNDRQGRLCRHPVLAVLGRRPEVRVAFVHGSVPAWCPAKSAKVAGAMLQECPECHRPYNDDHLLGGAKRTSCFTCHHFLEPRGPNTVIVERGPRRFLYTIGKEPAPGGSRDGLGFGGQRFEFELLDGTRIVSHNVWSGGDIPEELWPKLPVTARVK